MLKLQVQTDTNVGCGRLEELLSVENITKNSCSNAISTKKMKYQKKPSKEALEINKMTSKKLSSLPDPDETYRKFVELLDKYVDRFDKKDKFIAIGYGSEFDEEVIRHWFEKNDDEFFGSWFWHPWLCMMNASAIYLQNERKELKNFKLITVSDYLGIKVCEDNFHNALYDAKISREIYNKICRKN
jgi:DNA polymerase III subunit epsilon